MVSRKLIDAAATRLIPFRGQAAKPAEIEKALLDLGAAPCVARDWAGEPRRRELLASYARVRKARGLGRVRQVGAYKNILRTEIKRGRENMYHAAKGRRSFREARG